jgi:glutamate dehydrogenase
MGVLPTALVGAELAAFRKTSERFVKAGAPVELADRVAALGPVLGGLDIVEVAASTSTPVLDVATVYFALAEQLHLTWLRDRILALPRNDRWQALARAALRDDVYAAHAALTADVLTIGQGAPPGAALTMWTAARGSRIDRGLRAFAEIRTSGVADLATLSVALRDVRALVPARAGAV